MLQYVIRILFVVDSTNLLIESCNYDIQRYRLYLLIDLCKGFLMMINFKILLESI
jgi:hypothetical protein